MTLPILEKTRKTATKKIRAWGKMIYEKTESKNLLTLSLEQFCA
jgi:hypothetical protein